jgi:murein L,D-transpeptidase YafK
MARHKRIIRERYIVCLLLGGLMMPGASLAQFDGRLVWQLQRALNRGCGAYVVEDNDWGPQTRKAYQACREKALFPPADSLGQVSDVREFLEGIWMRKLGWALLHQYGYAQGEQEPSAGQRLDAALQEASVGDSIQPALRLGQGGIGRLYQHYMDNPPAGSLADSIKMKGLSFRQVEVFVQVFKREEEVNVFARRAGSEDSFERLKTFHVTCSPFTYEEASLDKAGPKTIQNDGKVPEGCYLLTWQNRWSLYHISYNVSYPNPGDINRTAAWDEGSNSGKEIFLHGNRVSVGCIPVGDAGIEEIALLLNGSYRESTSHGRIHIFPCRFGVEENEKALQRYAKERPELGAFWDSLRPIYAYFKKHKKPPDFHFDENGYYQLQK